MYMYMYIDLKHCVVRTCTCTSLTNYTVSTVIVHVYVIMSDTAYNNYYTYLETLMNTFVEYLVITMVIYMTSQTPPTLLNRQVITTHLEII